ncbi:HSP20 domain-containing protein, partial [Cephalotus follicularis]
SPSSNFHDIHSLSWSHLRGLLEQFLLVYPSRETTFSDSAIDYNETPEVHVCKINIPDFKREEVKVEIKDGNYVCISNAKKILVKEGLFSLYHEPRKLDYSIPLPPNVNVN